MIPTDDFIEGFSEIFPALENITPWEVTKRLPDIVKEQILQLGSEYEIKDGIAIHRTATVQQGVLVVGPVIIGPKCFIGAGAFLRKGVLLTNSVTIGTGCEVKGCIIFNNSSVAHFNFIGDSLIGSRVNFEAGAITANHYNERAHKRISVYYNSKIIETGSEKFGALVGDDSKIGANAVLSPGTLLKQGSIVKRLELVEQGKE